MICENHMLLSIGLLGPLDLAPPHNNKAASHVSLNMAVSYESGIDIMVRATKEALCTPPKCRTGGSHVWIPYWLVLWRSNQGNERSNSWQVIGDRECLRSEAEWDTVAWQVNFRWAASFSPGC